MLRPATLNFQNHLKDAPPSGCALGIASALQRIQGRSSLLGCVGPIVLDQQLSGQVDVLVMHQQSTRKGAAPSRKLSEPQR